MPLGSSSEAPVIRPGPKMSRQLGRLSASRVGAIGAFMVGSASGATSRPITSKAGRGSAVRGKMLANRFRQSQDCLHAGCVYYNVADSEVAAASRAPSEQTRSDAWSPLDIGWNRLFAGGRDAGRAPR